MIIVVPLPQHTVTWNNHCLWYLVISWVGNFDGHVSCFIWCQPKSLIDIHMVIELVWRVHDDSTQTFSALTGMAGSLVFPHLSPEAPFPSTAWDHGTRTHVVTQGSQDEQFRSFKQNPQDLLRPNHFCHILLVKQVTKAILVMGMGIKLNRKYRK